MKAKYDLNHVHRSFLEYHLSQAYRVFSGELDGLIITYPDRCERKRAHASNVYSVAYCDTVECHQRAHEGSVRTQAGAICERHSCICAIQIKTPKMYALEKPKTSDLICSDSGDSNPRSFARMHMIR
jgi:hypothetical protein